MKCMLLLPAIGLLLPGCKSTSYHYVSPTLNNTVYTQQGTGQLGLQFGTVGIGAKGGYALSDNININAHFGGIPEADNGYTSRESEFSLGFQTTPRSKRVTSFYVGTGIGSNEKDKRGLSANYYRPFLQVQTAAYDRPLFPGSNVNMYVDISAGLRLNYLRYNGKINGSDFDENVMYTEPYLGIAIGSHNVRLEILQGMTIKSSGTWEKGVRILPYMGNIGLLFKLRKE